MYYNLDGKKCRLVANLYKQYSDKSILVSVETGCPYTVKRSCLKKWANPWTFAAKSKKCWVDLSCEKDWVKKGDKVLYNGKKLKVYAVDTCYSQARSCLETNTSKIITSYERHP